MKPAGASTLFAIDDEADVRAIVQGARERSDDSSIGSIL